MSQYYRSAFANSRLRPARDRSIRIGHFAVRSCKVGVPDSTVNKRNKLNEAEWSEMRRHPDIGADFIMNLVWKI